jgi:hypothetical protein
MGIYLGQLPPAEIARFKAELAETLIANFCYPRFFDPRTQSLRMRPVDRAKRQEVWLYLSAVDFTAWGRVDLMSPDFQHLIEHLFILFVQRNRNFFGEQGRRRMSDIRLLIGMCAVSVTQALRNHLAGQKQRNPPFGSPRPIVSWSASSVGGRNELAWEQIASRTMLLQQQLQEYRGEVRPPAPPMHDGRPPVNNSTVRRPVHPQHASGVAGNATEAKRSVQSQVSVPPTAPPGVQKISSPSGPLPGTKNTPTPMPASVVAVPPTLPNTPTVQPAHLVAPLKSETPDTPPASTESQVTSQLPPARSLEADGPRRQSPALSERRPAALSAPAQVHSTSPSIPASASVPVVAAAQRETSVMTIGEDDLAIFEQMRHQLILWLRVEAVTAGLEIAGQGPSQLLELVRQHGRLDETRLQVVSTLLNLSGQVIKTGMVSTIDYKQALMFHLMHTKR